MTITVMSDWLHCVCKQWNVIRSFKGPHTERPFSAAQNRHCCFAKQYRLNSNENHLSYFFVISLEQPKLYGTWDSCSFWAWNWKKHQERKDEELIKNRLGGMHNVWYKMSDRREVEGKNCPVESFLEIWEKKQWDYNVWMAYQKNRIISIFVNNFDQQQSLVLTTNSHVVEVYSNANIDSVYTSKLYCMVRFFNELRLKFWK